MFDNDEDGWLYPDDDAQGDGQGCSLCGEYGACGYDSEGRAMVHADRSHNDDTD